jgi:hypothetical protein
MLARVQQHRHRRGHLERKDVLGVVRSARGISVAPAREDIVDILLLPVDDAAERGRVDPGLFAQLARGSRRERLARFLAAGHRLPVVGIVGTLKQQDAQIGRMHDHERGDRDLVPQCLSLNFSPGREKGDRIG